MTIQHTGRSISAIRSGILYQDSRSAERLAKYLRTANDDEMVRRRHIVGLSLTAAVAMGAIAAYQVGLLKKLPSPNIKGTDDSRITSSPPAYQILQTPDAFLGLLSYSTTAALAAMGGHDRARRLPWIPTVLAFKVAADSVLAAKKTLDQPKKFHAVCLLCVTASIATLAMLPPALVDGRRGIIEIVRRLKTKAAEHRSA